MGNVCNPLKQQSLSTNESLVIVEEIIAWVHVHVSTDAPSLLRPAKNNQVSAFESEGILFAHNTWRAIDSDPRPRWPGGIETRLINDDALSGGRERKEEKNVN